MSKAEAIRLVVQREQSHALVITPAAPAAIAHTFCLEIEIIGRATREIRPRRGGSSPAGHGKVSMRAINDNVRAAIFSVNGATHVVVVNLPNVGLSPDGIASSDGGANLTQLSQLFNDSLNAALQTDGLQAKVMQIDSYTWLNQIITNFQAHGFAVSNTSVACDPTKTPHATALLCSPPTYVSANADQTYMFADDLHPTTHLHALFAQFVEQQIANSGLGH
jgi:hypothetical protein